MAIVTGAATGMGEATAKLFAAASAKVLVADIDTAERRRTRWSIDLDAFVGSRPGSGRTRLPFRWGGTGRGRRRGSPALSGKSR